jgi:hypothetical protein
MKRVATIVGGPRDGKVVPITGPLLREPVPPIPRIFSESDELPPPEGRPFEIREYDLCTWDDMDEWAVGPRYVLRGVELGQR